MTTKEKILDSALKLFSTQGIDKTSTAQITKDVGIASGTLFVHFKTKQALIDTLYLQIKDGIVESLEGSIDLETSVEEGIKIVSKKMIEYFLNHYQALIFMELVENDPQVSQKAREAGRQKFTKFAEIMKGWQKTGKFKNLECEIIQQIIWNLILMLVRFCKAKNKKNVEDKYLEIVWDAIKK